MEAAEVFGKVAELLYAEDYGEHEGITEESIAEVMSWLELEIKLAAGAAALPLPPSPSPPPPPPPPAALYAAVSGCMESCGSSLSGPASTVMASVDWGAGAPPPPVPWAWLCTGPAATEEEEDDDGDEDDADDEWVSQLLTDGPAVEGPCGSQ